MANNHRNDNPEDGEERIYTVGDLARILRFSVGKIYRLHHAGMLPPPVPLGRSLRWNSEVIAKWIENGCPAGKRKRK